MILVAGESLIDLIVDPAGGVRASLGGGPYNAARTMARLGAEVQFLGRVSADPFGSLLAGGLAQSGVRLGQPAPVAEPSTLAVLSVTGDGIAQYWFHLTGTAGVLLDTGSAATALASGRVSGLHTGALGLLAEPMASGIETLAGQLPDRALLSLDPNCRPAATPDPDGYRARVQRLAARADIVKVSTDDLCSCGPGPGWTRPPPACSGGRARRPRDRRARRRPRFHRGSRGDRARPARRRGRHGGRGRRVRRRVPGLVG